MIAAGGHRRRSRGPTAPVTPQTLTCDPTHPVRPGGRAATADPRTAPAPPVWVPFVRQLTYADSDPLATCGGAATGALSHGGLRRAGRRLDQVDARTSASSRARRARPPGPRSSGEGQAVQQFDSGLLDLAYTAAGTDPDGRPRPVRHHAGRRWRCPVGIGAVTVGVGNGYGSGGRKVPFPTISMTRRRGGHGGGQRASTRPAERRRRSSPATPTWPPPSSPRRTDMQVGVPSGTSASTWYLSNYLTKVAPGTWKVPPVGAAGPDAGNPRGVFNDFGTASPRLHPADHLHRVARRSSRLLFGIVQQHLPARRGLRGQRPHHGRWRRPWPRWPSRPAPAGPFVAPDPGVDGCGGGRHDARRPGHAPARSAHPSDPDGLPAHLRRVRPGAGPAAGGRHLHPAHRLPGPAHHAGSNYVTGPGQSGAARRAGAAHPGAGRPRPPPPSPRSGPRPTPARPARPGAPARAPSTAPVGPRAGTRAPGPSGSFDTGSRRALGRPQRWLVGPGRGRWAAPRPSRPRCPSRPTAVSRSARRHRSPCSRCSGSWRWSPWRPATRLGARGLDPTGCDPSVASVTT